MEQIKSRQRVADHGEVFTGEREVKAMCDLVAGECLRTEARFLEPACGEGNFLEEILRRKLSGIRRGTRDWAREALLALSSLYGVDILDDNCALCRERLYGIWEEGYRAACPGELRDEVCRQARSVLSRNIVRGDALNLCLVDGEQRDTGEPIVFPEWALSPDGGLLCRGEHAFAALLSGAGPMEFDVIISNPPYQMSDAGNGASAKPLYHRFVELAWQLKPRFLTMIIPARWYSGGKGLDRFRAAMLNDDRVRVLVDYTDSKDCFPGVDVAGGVCYFLWDRDHPGLCRYTNHRNGRSTTAERVLNEYPTFIRYPLADRIIAKVRALREPTMDAMVTARKPFGLATNVTPREDGELILRYNKGTGKFPDAEITVGRENIGRWKVMLSYLTAEHAGQPDKNGQFRVISTLEILPPGHVCTETYLLAGCFDSEAEAVNLAGYMRTRFLRFLVGQIAVSQHITKNCFSFVPIQDFTRPWTDGELYAKYGLSDEEIAFIETLIKPMEGKGRG